MLEHFEDQKYRPNRDPSDRKKNVKQINHWNVIRVVFHVSSFLFLSMQRLKSPAERDALLHDARGSRRQMAKL
jgi:hypothetical protein